MAVGGKSSPCLLVRWHNRDNLEIGIAHAQGMLVDALKHRHDPRKDESGEVYESAVLEVLDDGGKLWIEAIDAQVLRKLGYTIVPAILLILRDQERESER